MHCVRHFSTVLRNLIKCKEILEDTLRETTPTMMYSFPFLIISGPENDYQKVTWTTGATGRV